MIKYIKESFNKFKIDALSKALYDVAKMAIISLAISYPSAISVINKSFTLSVTDIFIVVYLSVAITLISTTIHFVKINNNLKKDNQTDELTNMLNHKAFKEKMPQIINYCGDKEIKLSFIIIDIDNFKKFNEDFSYQIADKVLTKVGMLLNSDNRATDISFRQYFKGDEFIIITKETSLSNAIIATERKRKLFESGIHINNNIYNLTVSCGVTEYNFSSDTLESALLRLNDALKLAKRSSGKNCVKSLY